MVELENLKVAVAKSFGEAVFVGGDDDAWPRVGSEAIKEGWVMGKWRCNSAHDLKNDARKVRSVTM